MQWWQILATLGIPTFLYSIFSLFITRKLNKIDKDREKREKERDEREKRVENFLLAILSSQRATNTLATATAKAVQRIPDAKCNGDMKEALDEAVKCQNKENEFLTQLGISALNR